MVVSRGPLKCFIWWVPWLGGDGVRVMVSESLTRTNLSGYKELWDQNLCPLFLVSTNECLIFSSTRLRGSGGGGDPELDRWRWKYIYIHRERESSQLIKNGLLDKKSNDSHSIYFFVISPLLSIYVASPLGPASAPVPAPASAPALPWPWQAPRPHL